jgi:hypothetical protein
VSGGPQRGVLGRHRQHTKTVTMFPLESQAAAAPGATGTGAQAPVRGHQSKGFSPGAGRRVQTAPLPAAPVTAAPRWPPPEPPPHLRHPPPPLGCFGGAAAAAAPRTQSPWRGSGGGGRGRGDGGQTWTVLHNWTNRHLVTHRCGAADPYS